VVFDSEAVFKSVVLLKGQKLCYFDGDSQDYELLGATWRQVAIGWDVILRESWL